MQNSTENLILLSNVTWIHDLTMLRTFKVKWDPNGTPGTQRVNPFLTHGATKCNRDIPIYLSTTHVQLCTVRHTNEKFTNRQSSIVGYSMIIRYRPMEHNRRLSNNHVPSSRFNGPNISNSDVRNKNMRKSFKTKRTIF